MNRTAAKQATVVYLWGARVKLFVTGRICDADDLATGSAEPRAYVVGETSVDAAEGGGLGTD